MQKAGVLAIEVISRILSGDMVLMSVTLSNMMQTLKITYGIEGLANLDKKLNEQYQPSAETLKRITGIIQGMAMSDVNLLLFRDDSEVMMQYHMGLMLEKDTYILAEKKDEGVIQGLGMTSHPLVKKIYYVEGFGDKDFQKVMREFQEDVRSR